MKLQQLVSFIFLIALIVAIGACAGGAPKDTTPAPENQPAADNTRQPDQPATSEEPAIHEQPAMSDESAPSEGEVVLEGKVKEIVEGNLCLTCHMFGDVGKLTVGPNLKGVGSRLTADEIRTQLKDPKSRNTASLMPPVTMSDEDVETLVDFLSHF